VSQRGFLHSFSCLAVGDGFEVDDCSSFVISC